ncbi:MAG TPA: ABC transporter ATP-binding protein [Gaiellaceae bacterium]|nr:ABC transporter ATP-binding protein [Gaiellaceae bacterium]
MSADRTPLLEVSDVRKTFAARRPLADSVRRRPGLRAVAVDGVSLTVGKGERLGLVGESGSGKTTLARSILRLIEPDSGSIRFSGQELVGASRGDLQSVRRRMQMVFQDPYSSLNPRMKVGTAIAEPALVHHVIPRNRAKDHVAELLDLVGLPASSADRYPRQLSGGQRQRVAIARALSVQPEFLIADEPVSALDVSIQAQILNLLDDLLERLGLGMIFIAHQLAVVRHVADRVAIMYLGRIVETGSTDQVFQDPQHPYTKALLAAAPVPDPTVVRTRSATAGDMPSPLRIPSGCRFRTRCDYAEERCQREDPPLLSITEGHHAACHVRPFDHER